jgi:RHS repeat-associated protein
MMSEIMQHRCSCGQAHFRALIYAQFLTYNTDNEIATETRYSNLAGTALVGTASYSYDADGRLTNLQQLNSSGSDIANYTYSYDHASRLTQEQDNGTTTTYGYDADSELTSAGGVTYAYDQNGNRTMTGYTTGTDNELTNDGTWTYTYDDEGNLIEKSMGASATTWYYSYNLDNQMTSATEEATPGGTVLSQATYVYDAFGQLLEEDAWTSGTGASTTRFGYNQGNVWVDLNSSNQLVTRRLYLDGVETEFARISSGGTVAWYLPDRSGSIRDIINNSGTVLDAINYDAFGNITSESSPSNGDRYKWDGGELDSVTGLYLDGARYYSTGVGRWTSQDPLEFADSDPNLYRYAQNDPTNYDDPTGLASDPDDDDLSCVFFSYLENEQSA